MKTLVCILAFSLVSVTRAADTVPFHATIETEIQFLSGPPFLSLNISGDGHGSHVGRLHVDGPSQVDLTQLLQTGTSTLTASDGSTFDFEFEGSVMPSGQAPTDPVTFQGVWQLTSGTGRFVGASGGGSYSGSAAGGTGILILDGSLSNPGKKPSRG